VGAAIYAALLVSHDYLPSDRAEHQVFAQSLGNAGAAIQIVGFRPSGFSELEL
jgi:hypothetical protein